MPIIASNTGGGEFRNPEPGTHLAICFGIVDLGTQRGEYQGKPTVRRQVWIQWELPNETFEHEGVTKPFSVSKFYTLSLGEKSNLRPDLEAWRGRPFTAEEEKAFDISALLGKACMLSIVINAKGRAAVSSVSKVMKGLNVPPQTNPSRLFSLDEFDHGVFMSLPEGIRGIIERSDEYKALNVGNTMDNPQDDDIPF